MKPKRWMHLLMAFTVAGLTLTGLVWWAADLGLLGAKDFSRTVQFFLMRVHGALAMLVLVALGLLLGTHVTIAFNAGRLKAWGLVMLAGFILLTLSGWGLYYFADEQLRAWVEITHLVAGIALPVSYVGHVMERK